MVITLWAKVLGVIVTYLDYIAMAYIMIESVDDRREEINPINAKTSDNLLRCKIIPFTCTE